jgi:hypothetical protein
MICFKKYVQKRVERISVSISKNSDEKGRRQKKIGFTDTAKNLVVLTNICMALKHQNNTGIRC